VDEKSLPQLGLAVGGAVVVGDGVSPLPLSLLLSSSLPPTSRANLSEDSPTSRAILSDDSMYTYASVVAYIDDNMQSTSKDEMNDLVGVIMTEYRFVAE